RGAPRRRPPTDRTGPADPAWNESRHVQRSRAAPRLRPPTNRTGRADPAWNESRHVQRSRAAPRLRPPTNRTGRADPAWNESRHVERSRGAPTLRPPTDRTGRADPAWNESRHVERSRGAPTLRPPTDRTGPADLVKMITDVPGLRVGHAADPVGHTREPGAFLFDLGVGDRRARPTREMGYEAAARAVAGAVAEGSVGAGAGASVGKIHGIARAMRGGIGSASVRLGEIVVGALVAVNAIGDVRDPETGALVAGTRDAAEGRRLVDSARELLAGAALGRFAAPEHTTIGVVATNARLDRAAALRLPIGPTA